MAIEQAEAPETDPTGIFFFKKGEDELIEADEPLSEIAGLLTELRPDVGSFPTDEVSSSSLEEPIDISAALIVEDPTPVIAK